jgi:hypothetical protein
MAKAREIISLRSIFGTKLIEVFIEDGASAIIRAIAKHAPTTELRVLRDPGVLKRFVRRAASTVVRRVFVLAFNGVRRPPAIASSR